MRRGVLPALGTVMFALLGASSCDFASSVLQTKQPTAQHEAESRPSPYRTDAANPEQSALSKLPIPVARAVTEVFDTDLRSTGAIPLTGDRRPIWIFSGRIRNHSVWPLVAITLHISVYDQAAMDIADSADVHLSTRILPREVRSFAENIQITPPHGKWSWSVEVTEANRD